MTTTTNGSKTHQDLAIYRTGRSRALDLLAYEQVLLNCANDTDMTVEDASRINAASFRNREERIFFENQYRRHARNAAAGNRFYE